MCSLRCRTRSRSDGALAEPTAVAVHDVNRAGLREGERALVVGGGPIGLLIASVASARGAEVLVLELSEPRRAFANELGLRSIDPTAGDLEEVVADWTDAPVRMSHSRSPRGRRNRDGDPVLAVRGRLVVVAIHSTPAPVNLFRVFWRELTLIGARVYERADFEAAVGLLASGAVPAARMITRIDPLDEVAAAFAELESVAR